MTDRNNVPPPPRRRPTDHIAAAPAQPGGRTNGAFQGAPNGNARRVVEHSVYNWVELVYEAFGLTVPSDPKKVAFLGVRESTFAGVAGASAEDILRDEQAAGRSIGETDAATSTQALEHPDREADRFSRDRAGQPQRTKGSSLVTFNDLLYMVWTNEGQDKDQHVEVFRCTIDPGFNEDTTTGTPLLCEGYPYKAEPTTHKGTPGMRIYSGTSPNIRIAREATKSRNTFTNLEDALLAGSAENGNQPWLFCYDQAIDPGIHIHGSDDYSAATMVKNWSTGCTVLSHSPSSPRYLNDFRAHWNAAPNKTEVPYLVVSSKYVKLYDAWQAELRADPSKKADAASVIKLEGIPRMPTATPAGTIPGGTAPVPATLTPPGPRLPSIATAPFVQAVQQAISQLEAGTFRAATMPRGSTPAQLAANLRTSLANLGITTLTVS